MLRLRTPRFSVSIGNPYNGSGVQIGQPYGYGYGLGGTGTTYYGSGYSGYVAPGTTSFSTGYLRPAAVRLRRPGLRVAAGVVHVRPYRTYGYRLTVTAEGSVSRSWVGGDGDAGLG